MQVSIVQYPGSHHLEATVYAYSQIIGAQCRVVLDSEESIGTPDLLVLPGGSSYADYLRPGALAKISRINGAIRRFAQDGGAILGIGNGFQILIEMGLLPGALLINRTTKFVGGTVAVRTESKKTPFTRTSTKRILRLPIGCYYGCYYADPRTLRDLEENGNVVLRYCDQEGELDPELDLTGSINQIAAVSNRQENIVGMMVHPELAVEELTGGTDGLELLKVAPKAV